jgi:hypothetical protein
MVDNASDSANEKMEERRSNVLREDEEQMAGAGVLRR